MKTTILVLACLVAFVSAGVVHRDAPNVDNSKVSNLPKCNKSNVGSHHRHVHPLKYWECIKDRFILVNLYYPAQRDCPAFKVFSERCDNKCVRNVFTCDKKPEKPDPEIPSEEFEEEPIEEPIQDPEIEDPEVTDAPTEAPTENPIEESSEDGSGSSESSESNSQETEPVESGEIEEPEVEPTEPAPGSGEESAEIEPTEEPEEETEETPVVEPEPEIPESGEVEPELPESGEVEPELPESGEVEPELPESGEIEPELPESGEVEPELPESEEAPSCEVKCSEHVDQEKGEYHANPKSCASFYQCAQAADFSWYPVLHECPAGLEFNAALFACDWPSSANCVVSCSSA